MESQFREKVPVIPIENFRLLDNPGLQLLIMQFPLYYLSNGRLREFINKGKFQNFSSKSGRGRLREVVAYKRFQIK